MPGGLDIVNLAKEIAVTTNALYDDVPWFFEVADAAPDL